MKFELPLGRDAEDRYGLVTTRFSLAMNVMFAPVPRTLTAHYYRELLGLDISMTEGLYPVDEADGDRTVGVDERQDLVGIGAEEPTGVVGGAGEDPADPAVGAAEVLEDPLRRVEQPRALVGERVEDHRNQGKRGQPVAKRTGIAVEGLEIEVEGSGHHGRES